MWIKFQSTRLYLVRIYVDGVNAVTGRTSPLFGEQAYVLVPDQEFVNGYHSTPSAMVQFVCPPFSTRGVDQPKLCDIQFEVTPYEPSLFISINVKSFWGNWYVFGLAPSARIKNLKTLIHARVGVPPPCRRLHLVRRGRRLEGMILT
jgi:hypothetical protein